MEKNPVVKMITNRGDINIELYPEIAPITVKNFITLVEKGYYDDLTFHRVIKGFMLQGGCPDGTGTGGPGYCIDGEFNDNDFKNDLKHTEGIISMARTGDPNSAGSQFFIMHKAYPSLDGAYAAFGKVVEGMDVVNTIAETKTSFGDKPVEPQIITKITLEK